MLWKIVRKRKRHITLFKVGKIDTSSSIGKAHAYLTPIPWWSFALIVPPSLQPCFYLSKTLYRNNLYVHNIHIIIFHISLPHIYSSIIYIILLSSTILYIYIHSPSYMHPFENLIMITLIKLVQTHVNKFFMKCISWPSRLVFIIIKYFKNVLLHYASKYYRKFMKK